MNTTYQNLFDATIVTEPPSRLDLDVLIVRSRRRLRVRRWAATGAGTAVLVGILGAVFGLGPGLPGSAPPGGGGVEPGAATSSPGAAVRPKPTLAGREPTEDPRAAKDRLARAMRAGVLRAVPGALLGGGFSVDHVVRETSPTSDGNWMAPAYAFQARQTVSADGIHGVIDIVVRRGFLSEACQVPLPKGSVISCQQSAGPNGELVVVENAVDGSTFGTLLRKIVRVQRPDGCVVYVITSNLAALPDELVTVDGEPKAEFTTTQPPLTIAQMTKIGLDPALTIYP